MSFSLNLSFGDILNEKTRKFLFLKIGEYGVASRLTVERLETREPENKAETIIVFAKKLGKKTVAEFVHSKEICEIVKEWGVD